MDMLKPGGLRRPAHTSSVGNLQVRARPAAASPAPQTQERPIAKTYHIPAAAQEQIGNI